MNKFDMTFKGKSALCDLNAETPRERRMYNQAYEEESRDRYMLEEKYKYRVSSREADKIAQEVLDFLRPKELACWQIQDIFILALERLTWRKFE